MRELKKFVEKINHTWKNYHLMNETNLDKKILKDVIDSMIELDYLQGIRPIIIEIIYKARGFDK